jgi:hypothetical protein
MCLINDILSNKINYFNISNFWLDANLLIPQIFQLAMILKNTLEIKIFRIHLMDYRFFFWIVRDGVDSSKKYNCDSKESFLVPINYSKYGSLNQATPKIILNSTTIEKHFVEFSSSHSIGDLVISQKVVLIGVPIIKKGQKNLFY